MTRNPLSIFKFPTRLRWSLLALVIVCIVVGVWLVNRPKASPPPKTAEQEAEMKKNEVLELSPSDSGLIETRELQLSLKVSGNLVPIAQATVKSKVSGSVQQTLVQEGMAVQAGQILARLDTADSEARVATQQATLEEAMARLSLAKKNSVNNQTLLKQNYISQNAYDTSQNSVDLAQAGVKSAQAQLAIARIALADSVIYAPIAGIISKRYLQSGDKASPDLPLFTLVNLAQMTLEAQVASGDIGRVKIGQDVEFQIDGFTAHKFHGKVERINPNADANSRNLLVYVRVDNKDGSLKGGMYVKGSILLEKSRAMPLLPLVALRPEPGKNIVYKIDNGKIVEQAVKLGLRNEDEGLVEVLDGLHTGNQVLLTRPDNIKPGSKVKLANTSVSAPAATKATKG
jgi:RND family efflux transporter MFP subunit